MVHPPRKFPADHIALSRRRVATRLTIGFTGATFDRLKAMAEDGNVSIGHVVRQAVAYYLANHDQE